MRVRVRRGLAAAGIAGVLAGGVTAVATRGSSSSAGNAGTASTLRPERGPLRTALPQTLPPRPGAAAVRPAYPAIAGTRPRVVARVADPYGGPPWAIRLFDRRAARSRGQQDVRGTLVTCAQVGRIVAGRFVWIDPDRTRALRVPVRMTETTICTGRGRVASVAALRVPIGAPAAALPGVAATVFWGIARDARTVAVRRGSSRTELPRLAAGSRLVVARGVRPVGGSEVVADGRVEPRGIANAPYFAPTPRILVGPSRVTSPRASVRQQRPISQIERSEGFSLAAVVADPAEDRPALVVTSRIPGSGAPCWGSCRRWWTASRSGWPRGSACWCRRAASARWRPRRGRAPTAGRAATGPAGGCVRPPSSGGRSCGGPCRGRRGW